MKIPTRSVVSAAPVPEELQVVTVANTKPSWVHEGIGILWLHGSGATATSMMSDSETRNMMNSLAQYGTVLTGDFGFNTWGNDLFLTRAEQARTHLFNNYGVSGKLILVGASMGFINACNYALRYPQYVHSVAGIIPGCDLTDLWATKGGYSDINSAYGGSYVPAIHGVERSPIEIASQIDPNIDIHLWNAPNDPITVPSSVDEFIVNRPGTKRDLLPPLGHTLSAIAASEPYVKERIKSWSYEYNS